MGPYGLLQTVNFIQLGLGIIALAAGLWMTVRPRPRVGLAFVFLLGIAIVLSIFTTDVTSGKPTTWHCTIHVLAFILMLLSTMFGSLVYAIQIRYLMQLMIISFI